ncbi:MAG: hypothetical protein LBS55_07345 [Prevotellaceae bacterium]|jgi:Fe-S-cluster-containing dehydrogenase component|nr:hypothetical protein [Prevotellaceae bacterium]
MKKGYILINRNICDNSPACGGIDVCKNIAEALFWDEKEGRVAYNADLCTRCGECTNEERGCPVGALRLAETEEEYTQIEQEIAADTRRIEDLKVERYGAEPIEECISINELDSWLKEQNKTDILLVELFTENSIQCLLYSIKVEDIQANIAKNSKYIKVQLAKEEDIINPTIEEVPALLIYKEGKLLGKTEGYYDESEQEVFFNTIKQIIGNQTML